MREGDAMNPLALSLRAKKLGVLLQDARLATQKTVDECAQLLHISASEYQEYEMGERSPSLPEVEALAYFFNVPLSHFWENTVLNLRRGESEPLDFEKMIPLRQRVVGTILRRTREEKGLSSDELAHQLNLTPAQLETAELGETPLPLPQLDELLSILHLPLEELVHETVPFGQAGQHQQGDDGNSHLTPELRKFISLPVNLPYLQLAQRLSEMSVEKLRAIGEGILDITL